MQTTPFIACNANFCRDVYSEEHLSMHPALNILLNWDELHLCLTALLFVLMGRHLGQPKEAVIFKLSDTIIKLHMPVCACCYVYIVNIASNHIFTC